MKVFLWNIFCQMTFDAQILSKLTFDLRGETLTLRPKWTLWTVILDPSKVYLWKFLWQVFFYQILNFLLEWPLISKVKLDLLGQNEYFELIELQIGLKICTKIFGKSLKKCKTCAKWPSTFKVKLDYLMKLNLILSFKTISLLT